MKHFWDDEAQKVVIKKYGQRIELSKKELLEVISQLPGVASAKEGAEDKAKVAADSAPSDAEIDKMHAYYEDYDIRYREAKKEFEDGKS